MNLQSTSNYDNPSTVIILKWHESNYDWDFPLMKFWHHFNKWPVRWHNTNPSWCKKKTQKSPCCCTSGGLWLAAYATSHAQSITRSPFPVWTVAEEIARLLNLRSNGSLDLSDLFADFFTQPLGEDIKRWDSFPQENASVIAPPLLQAFLINWMVKKQVLLISF